MTTRELTTEHPPQARTTGIRRGPVVRRLAATVALAGLLALTAACGDTDDGGSALPSAGDGTGATDASDGPSSSPSVDPEDALLAFAECMRENGVDMDDPKDGRLIIKGTDVDPETMEAAEEACGELRDAAMPDDGEPMEISPEQKQALLDIAQCMRDRGYDFDDPEFSGGGIRQRFDRESGIDPEDPTFQADLEQCRDESGFEPPSLDDEDS